LVDDGVVIRSGGGRFLAANGKSSAVGPVGATVSMERSSLDPLVIGRITVHPAGYGFVNSDDGTVVFVPALYRGPALDGDLVEVVTWPGQKGTEGNVVGVLSRGRTRITGILKRVRKELIVEPDDARIAIDYGFIALDDDVADKSAVGQSVVVRICRYPTDGNKELVGRLERVIGPPDEPRTEIAKILVSAGISEEFTAESMNEAEATPGEVIARDFADRIDLRDRQFFTIDPNDARDFDDALCVEDGPAGMTRVWVAIADVAHYVAVDSAIDRDAQERGFSTYLPSRVVPMLPLALSSGICSLKPDTERCAMVVRMDFTPDGGVRDTSMVAAVIRSRARLDYSGVAAALCGDFGGSRQHYRPWSAALSRLSNLAQILRRHRMNRGALVLEIPEPKVILDDDNPDLVRDVVQSKGSEEVRGAYQLVEEFMIAANEAVGRFFADRGLTAVWRVHAPPERERIEELAVLLGSYGIALDVDDVRTPRGLKNVIEQLENHTELSSLSFLLLRSLKQAVYDTTPTGHFGLASEHYLHFTSPILSRII